MAAPAAAGDGALQAEAYKKLYAEAYFENFIKDGIRPDGRGLSVARPVTVGLGAVSSADGSAIVKVGATTVLAGVRLEVMLPRTDAPGAGQLVVGVDMTALSSPDWRPGKQPGLVAAVQQRLADVLLGCGVLRPAALCIAEGQAAWVVYLDLYVLNAAGSLLDACLLAAVAALRDTRLPAVHVTDEGNVERDAASPGARGGPRARGAPLPLRGAPLCLSCGVYKGGQLVADPDHEEEALMVASISVVLDGDAALLGVYSVGPATHKQVLAAAELAAGRHAELLAQLEAAGAMVPRSRGAGPGVALLLLAGAAALAAGAPAPGEQPHVCVVIRTYWAHGTFGDASLMGLLASLKRQTHESWSALLLVLDNRPFPDLRHIVRDAADERIDVFAEWISARYAPKTPDGRQWAHDYHAKLYNLTDEAIRACPRRTRWVVVTNGDNDYDARFMAALVKHDGAEAVAFDYYSRYQRPTGTPCARFAAGRGLPPCKANGLTWCQTDLAAVAYSWPRFVADDMRFGVLESGQGANHDGIMADVVRTRRWKVAHVAGRCLVEHAPSPQRCAAEGGVWDDTAAATDAGSGGACLGPDRAAARLAALGPAAELVEVAVSHDPDSFGFGALRGAPLRLGCIRAADPAAWALARYFPRQCAAEVDLDASDGGARQPAAVEAAARAAAAAAAGTTGDDGSARSVVTRVPTRSCASPTAAERVAAVALRICAAASSGAPASLTMPLAGLAAAWLARPWLLWGVGPILASNVGFFVTAGLLELALRSSFFAGARIVYPVPPGKAQPDRLQLVAATHGRIGLWKQARGSAKTLAWSPQVLVNGATLTALMAWACGPVAAWWPASAAAGLAQFVALVVLADLGLYWGHRLQHESKFLWRMHAKHHAIDTPTPLSTLFIHPVDAALQGSIPLALAALAVRPAPAVLYAFIAGRIAENAINHSGLDSALLDAVTLKALPLRASAAHHDAHHRYCNHALRATNYGESFWVWDWLFGTRCKLEGAAAAAKAE
ncbi:EXOSC8 [Scenedesmus sp. PABB004]|nr:EXOSC8 [Scenedesmus sp. PABB004]